MFYLASHNGATYAFALKSLDKLRKLTQRKPVNRDRASVLDFRRSLFLDRGDDHFISRSPRRIEHKERKLTVAGDEADFFLVGGHEVDSNRKSPSQSSIQAPLSTPPVMSSIAI